MDSDGGIELLDAKQIAARLGVHPVTVRKWMTDGDLPSVKLGRRRVTRRPELVKFINARFDQDGVA